MRSKIILFVFILVHQSEGVFGQAQDEIKEKWIDGVSLTIENDTFLRAFGLGGLNEDRNYTQGADLSLTSTRLANKLFNRYSGKNVSNNIIEVLPTKITLLRLAAFTPDDLRQRDPIKGERPYSSVIWIGISNTVVDQITYESKGWNLSFGVMGIPGAAEYFQTAIHQAQNDNNTKPPYDPEGWDNQISHGGEPTILATYNSKKLLNPKSLEAEAHSGTKPKSWKKMYIQFVNLNTIDLGHVTRAGTGIGMRVGKLDLSNWYNSTAWNLDAETKLFGDDDPKADYFSKDKTTELFFFADLKADIMVYNGSLHGQFRNSNYRLPYWQTGFLGITGRTGVAFNSKRFSTSIYVGGKSSEIWNEYSRGHYWAGISLNYQCH